MIAVDLARGSWIDTDDFFAAFSSSGIDSGVPVPRATGDTDRDWRAESVQVSMSIAPATCSAGVAGACWVLWVLLLLLLWLVVVLAVIAGPPNSGGGGTAL